MESIRTEKDGEVGQSQAVYDPYRPHEIYEAPGIDAIARDKDPNYPGNRKRILFAITRSCPLIHNA